MTAHESADSARRFARGAASPRDAEQLRGPDGPLYARLGDFPLSRALIVTGWRGRSEPRLAHLRYARRTRVGAAAARGALRRPHADEERSCAASGRGRGAPWNAGDLRARCAPRRAPNQFCELGARPSDACAREFSRGSGRGP